MFNYLRLTLVLSDSEESGLNYSLGGSEVGYQLSVRCRVKAIEFYSDAIDVGEWLNSLDLSHNMLNILNSSKGIKTHLDLYPTV